MIPPAISGAEAMRRLSAALGRYEDVIKDLNALRKREGRDRLYELLRARRTLAEHIMLLRDAGLAAFAGQPELVGEFRAHLSKVMNGMALLQADWPVVKLDSDLEGYRRAAGALGETQHQFIAWLREAMAAQPTP